MEMFSDVLSRIFTHSDPRHCATLSVSYITCTLFLYPTRLMATRTLIYLFSYLLFKLKTIQKETKSSKSVYLCARLQRRSETNRLLLFSLNFVSVKRRRLINASPIGCCCFFCDCVIRLCDSLQRRRLLIYKKKKKKKT